MASNRIWNNFQLALGEKSNLMVLKEDRLKVILDSNFLFIPSQFHLDIFKELENKLSYVQVIDATPPIEEVTKTIWNICYDYAKRHLGGQKHRTTIIG